MIIKQHSRHFDSKPQLLPTAMGWVALIPVSDASGRVGLWKVDTCPSLSQAHSLENGCICICICICICYLSAAVSSSLFLHCTFRWRHRVDIFISILRIIQGGATSRKGDGHFSQKHAKYFTTGVTVCWRCDWIFDNDFVRNLSNLTVKDLWK